jgi:hypothetical protein
MSSVATNFSTGHSGTIPITLPGKRDPLIAFAQEWRSASLKNGDRNQSGMVIAITQEW